MARPTKYKPEYAAIARRLYLLREDDCLVADYFGVDLLCIAQWAWDHEEFFDAITPPADVVAQWKADTEARKIVSRQKKRAYLSENASARIANCARARMWQAIKGKGLSCLPYTVADLMAHLESKMLEGMTWENYGSWHIDHIKPCALFDLTIAEQFDECWSLSNLQPLWASDNIRKGAKYAGT